MTPDEIAENTNATGGMKRRDFLAAGAGLFVCSRGPCPGAAEPGSVCRPGKTPRIDFNAHLKIGADGRVTLMAGKVELGQGAMTELAMALAEELGVSLASIDVIMGDTDLCPFDMGTFGSMCTPLYWPGVRAAGAEAKAVLFAMAAERFAVLVNRLQAQAGTIRVAGDASNSVTYAQLVEGKRIERHLANVPVKPVTGLALDRHLARAPGRPGQSHGKSEIRRRHHASGLLHAAVLRPPAHGAKLRSADTSAAEKMTGVRVVKDGGMVAVLADLPDLAREALDKIKAEWDRPAAGPDDKTIFDHLRKTAPFEN